MNEITNVPAPAPVRKATLVAGSSVSAIVPRSVEEAFRLAEIFCVAGMVPESYNKGSKQEVASKVMLGILKGAEVGLPPVTALSTIYIVNNRPSIFGDGALALVQVREDYAGCREWIEGKPETDEYVAHCEIKRKTAAGEIITTLRSFSWGEAKRAGLTGKGVWRQYPQRMLQMRARAWAIRDSFSDALSGLHIAEEAQDIPQKQEQADTGFLDAGMSVPSSIPETDAQPEVDATDWNATADTLLKSLAEVKDKAGLTQFIEASEGARDGLKGADAIRSQIIDAAIAAKESELGK